MTEYIVLEKKVGETPLECVERWRAQRPDHTDIPLAYAGRLDPMASGKLLILIGDTCKRQAEYHGLDKAYEFSVLIGLKSDSGDVLGIVEETGLRDIQPEDFDRVLTELVGPITLPYPIFSARTVQGKPLHTWAVEGRLAEIQIPHKTSRVYSIHREKMTVLSREAVYTAALQKIDSLPTVTDPRKALGNDFRRPDVKASWKKFRETNTAQDQFIVMTCRCIASSGTYMRSLAEEIGRRLGTSGLAFSIHRTQIGTYDPMSTQWSQEFC